MIATSVHAAEGVDAVRRLIDDVVAAESASDAPWRRHAAAARAPRKPAPVRREVQKARRRAIRSRQVEQAKRRPRFMDEP